MSDTVHRGRRKKDATRKITISLTKEEFDALKRLAESQCRTATGQAVWEIQKALARHASKEEA